MERSRITTRTRTVRCFCPEKCFNGGIGKEINYSTFRRHRRSQQKAKIASRSSDSESDSKSESETPARSCQSAHFDSDGGMEERGSALIRNGRSSKSLGLLSKGSSRRAPVSNDDADTLPPQIDTSSSSDSDNESPRTVQAFKGDGEEFPQVLDLEKSGQSDDVGISSNTDSSQVNAAVTTSTEMSTASSTDIEADWAESDSSSSDTDCSREDVDESAMFVDEDTDEILLYSGANFTIYEMAAVLNQLQRVNNQSDLSMNRIYSVIKALLPLSDQEFPTLPQLRAILLKNVPRVRRIHACAKDCVLFIGEYKHLD